MSDPEPNNDKRERHPMVVAAMVGGLGMEFVALVVVSFLIGSQLDERFDMGPWGTVVTLALGMLGGAWHLYLLTKRFLVDQGE